MDELLIRVYAERATVLAGETLPVTALVANEGPEPVSVASLETVEYRLAGREDDTDRYRVSNPRLNVQLTTSPAQLILPAAPVALESKRQVDRRDDIAALSPEPFAPGEYAVTATYEHNGSTLTSPPASIDIRVPNVENLAAAMCNGDPERSTVLACRDEFGGVVLLERQSTHGDPRYGVFHRRRRFDATAGADDIATSVDIGSINGGRWIAWLEGGFLGASKSWAESSMNDLEPVPVDLANPKFVRPGFQFENGAGLFVVKGTVDGESRLRPYLASPSGGLKTLPESNLGPGWIGDVLASYDARQMRLVWAAGDRNAPKIYTRGYPAGAMENEPRLLAELAAPLLAMELAPVGPRTAVAVHVLSGAEGRLNFQRIPLEGDATAVESYDLDAPAEAVEFWAISPSPGGGSPVLAKSGRHILWRQTRRGDAWSVFSEDALMVRHLRLFTLEGSMFWVEWIDPRFGHLIRPLAGEYIRP